MVIERGAEFEDAWLRAGGRGNGKKIELGHAADSRWLDGVFKTGVGLESGKLHQLWVPLAETDDDLEYRPCAGCAEQGAASGFDIPEVGW